ncbi:major facilitator superfamily domain-containing protein [Roridomyces roridus]|uniref:Major facilitator superfamily domain-containing protein n=1 Tax=Roridomyces roridus TaxID=1738132 RepID=A0AAD7FVU0_9AGAR|nr:major facilitator superfamily domain-containing protein [Roridomyces roridus]
MAGTVSTRSTVESTTPTFTNTGSSLGKLELGLEAESSVVNDEFPVKDGGLKAWCTLIGGTLIFASTIGYINAFGVYQDHYTRGGLSASSVSWLGSTQLFLLVSLGLPAGKLVDMGYFRHTICAGSIIYIGSLLAVSFTDQTKYYQIFLSQGLGMGLGSGLLYVPAMAVQARHWKKRRPMAVGVVLVGAAIGGLIFPIVINRLLTRSSFANAVRASLYIVIGMLGTANAIMTCPETARQPESDSSIKIIAKDSAYWFMAFGALLILSGVFFPYFYLQLYAILHQVDSNLAFYSLAVMNAASIPGRIGPNLLAAKFGVLNVLTTFSALCGLLVFALFGVTNAGGMFAFAAVYGFCSGAWLSLITLAFATTARHQSEIGIRLGVGYFIAAFGGLVGSPIDGALLDRHRYFWYRPIIFTSVVALAGSVLLLISRNMIARSRGTPFV